MIYEWEYTDKITLAQTHGARDTLADAKAAAEAAAEFHKSPKYRLEVIEIEGIEEIQSWVRYAHTDWKLEE